MLTKFRISVVALVGVTFVLFAATYQLATPEAGASESQPIVVAHAEPAADASPAPATAMTKAELIELAQEDPWGLAQRGQRFYVDHVRGYSAIFKKRERINGKLRDEEVIQIRFREAPTSVYFKWIENADQAKRALYIDTPEFTNDDGEKLAKIEPAGALVRLVVSEVEIPIRGERAKKSSRRTLDEFGFKSTLKLLDRYNRQAAEEGVLHLRYTGTGEIDGRPTFVMERILPYTGEDGPWPDAKMVMHLDQEWLQPLAVYSYADKAGKKLLGSYVFEDVRLNPQFDKDAFTF